jgi:thymidylate kinase
MFTDLTSYHEYDVICDRFHLGMYVYGVKYRNMDPKEVWAIDEYWTEVIPTLNRPYNMEVWPTVIVLTDYAEKINERDDGLGLEVDVSDIENTRQTFLAAFEQTKAMNKLHINITDNGGFANTLPTVTAFLDTIKKGN